LHHARLQRQRPLELIRPARRSFQSPLATVQGGGSAQQVYLPLISRGGLGRQRGSAAAVDKRFYGDLFVKSFLMHRYSALELHGPRIREPFGGLA